MGETDKLQREVDEVKLKPYNCVCVSIDGGPPLLGSLTEVGVRTYRRVWKRSIIVESHAVVGNNAERPLVHVLCFLWLL